MSAIRNSPLKIIDEYCQRNLKSKTVRNIAFGVYQEQLEELIAGKTTARSEPSPAEVATMQETLLSAGSLAAIVKLAEEMLNAECHKELRPILRREGLRSYWISISSNIVASIIYSLLLILLFIIARDQIASWLSSLQPPSK